MQFCTAYRHISEHSISLIATGTTGRLVEEAVGLPVQKLPARRPWRRPAGHGSYRLRGSGHAAVLPRPHLLPSPREPNEMNLLRICDVHNIPVATNIATAEVLIHGLEHGDLDWRTILNPPALRAKF